MFKQISDNEIYLLAKYIKSVFWRVAKRLSYIEVARCQKFKLKLAYLKLFTLQTICENEPKSPRGYHNDVQLHHSTFVYALSVESSQRAPSSLL